MRRRLLPLALLPLTGLLLAPPHAGAAATKPGLSFGPNTYAYTSSYGEPALAIAGDGTVYTSTPGDGGAVLARSDDKGKSWTPRTGA